MAANRGFKTPKRQQSVNPRVRKAEGTRGTPLPGAARVRPQSLVPAKAYPPMPPTWLKSEGEWVVYWYLKYHKGWDEGTDFYFDTRIFVEALLRGVPLTQADFLIDLGPTSPLGSLGWFTALVLDPFTEFTHDFQYDKDRRDALAEEGYLLIFLAEETLKQGPIFLLDEALRGRDYSNRGSLGRTVF